ncbi:MAG: hypothetical protein JSV85_00840 [Candidatus Bathyarchaeota archaeon]|nr:MAG: hypothetical protein JSV85_00840 [Candidatus Bathyarchaeota archaeon]
MSQQLQEQRETDIEDTVNSLNDIRQEAGQISELSTEENMLVEEFILALLKIMQPLASTLPVSTSVLPEEWGKVTQASIDLTGQLLVLHPDKRMKTVNLTEQRHRELLLEITHDIMPTLKKLVNSYREKVEARVKFMSSVTKELQRTAKAFSTDNVKQLTS